MSSESQLQQKADQVLAETIQRVKDLGYAPYDIQPRVRLTNNRSRIGSAKELNGAFARVPGKRGAKQLKPGRTPLFQISVARSEFTTEEDLLNVMFHEVIHACPDCQNHGKTFQAIAKHVNRVYGTHVATTKDVGESSQEASVQTKKIDDSVLFYLLEKHIGERFVFKRKTYTFVGFNHNNPKNSCELRSIDGKMYKTTPQLVAEYLGIITN